MGRKSSAKSHGVPQPEPARSSTRVTAAIVVALVALGAVIYLRQGNGDPQQTVAAQAPLPQNLKPHTQDKLPPLDIPTYVQRPPEVIRAAYLFAAEHPEVLSYVPCFCGCEAAGHRGNHDCFVRERAVNGDVIAWDEHGTDCTMCIDVAGRSRQLFAEGKSVADIRATIEREWAGKTTSHTPTPQPPKNSRGSGP